MTRNQSKSLTAVDCRNNCSQLFIHTHWVGSSCLIWAVGTMSVCLLYGFTASCRVKVTDIHPSGSWFWSFTTPLNWLIIDDRDKNASAYWFPYCFLKGSTYDSLPEPLFHVELTNLTFSSSASSFNGRIQVLCWTLDLGLTWSWQNVYSHIFWRQQRNKPGNGLFSYKRVVFYSGTAPKRREN